MQVLLVAGDTFRAAAAEQLAGWAERSKAELAVASNQKQRPDALMYSAIDRVGLPEQHYGCQVNECAVLRHNEPAIDSALPHGASRCMVAALYQV